MMPTRREFIAAAGLCAGGLATTQVSAPPQAQNEACPHVAWARQVPVRYTCDVAVIGAGIAGVSAAMAAAQSGARVTLVEGFGVAGGNATVGGVGAFCGETAGQGEAFDTIVKGLEAFGAIDAYRPYPQADNRKFESEILAVVLQELLIRRGVKLLLHTRFVDANVREGRVTECLVCGASGPEALQASQFIDCTGEAQLVRQAGFEVVKGRPEDGLQLPMSMMFFVRHVADSDRRAQVPDGWFEAIRRPEDLPMTSLWPNGPGSNAIKVKIPRFDATNTESLAAAEIRARRRMMEVLDYYQRVEAKPWILDHASTRIGLREGHRIVGDYVLTVQDLRAGRAFEDGIARGVYCLDGHKPDDDKRTYILPEQERQVPPYQIPFRCLVPREAKNLLAAGRCLSADQLALSSARVMPTCAMMGQAAGVAAALATAGRCCPRDLDPTEIVRVLRDRGAALGVG